MTELAVETYVGMPVKAIQLTAENARDVAEWIGGLCSTRELVSRSDEGKQVVKSIRVYLDREKQNKRVNSDSENNKSNKGGAWHFGSIGDWYIMSQDGRVRIFPDDKFKGIFVKYDELNNFIEVE